EARPLGGREGGTTGRDGLVRRWSSGLGELERAWRLGDLVGITGVPTPRVAALEDVVVEGLAERIRPRHTGMDVLVEDREIDGLRGPAERPRAAHDELRTVLHSPARPGDAPEAP